MHLENIQLKLLIFFNSIRNISNLSSFFSISSEKKYSRKGNNLLLYTIIHLSLLFVTKFFPNTLIFFDKFNSFLNLFLNSSTESIGNWANDAKFLDIL